MLTHDKIMQHAPTLMPSGAEELVIGNVRFKAFDLGGHEAARKVRPRPAAHATARRGRRAAAAAALTPSPPPLPAQVWTNYFPEVNAIVYIVDAADRDRFPEAKTELDALLSTDSLANVPFLILGNKIDVPGAAAEMELRGHLGLHETTGKAAVNRESGLRPTELFMCSLVKKFGYGDGFKWLTNFIA